MATTYLDLTNVILRELNEVPLTSTNFASAVGFQQFVKDSINKAIFDIANEEPQLPFFSAGLSGATDPFYGNTTVSIACIIPLSARTSTAIILLVL